MNTNKFKVICYWIIVIDLVIATLTVLGSVTVSHLSRPDYELQLAGPQEGHGN